MNEPASMKKGTAMNENESIPENMICVIMTSGLSMKKNRMLATDRHSEKATGTPSAVSSKNNPNNTYSMPVLPVECQVPLPWAVGSLPLNKRSVLRIR